ncbi:MAG: hypothetical protein K8U57_16330 [Planctomycetes bacterium]|nr:hypothetical protein [Planctomycetota bacterium]
MSRLLALTLLGFTITTSAHAAEPVAASGDVPEKLLSPTSQLYVRWDGITAHADTYQKSFWGPLMAGPSGDSIRALLAKVPKLIGNSLLAEPLLDGKPPKELKANLADLKNASKLVDLLADKGVVVGAEVREPAPTLKGLGSALGGLLGGRMPGPDALMPTVQVLVVIPDVGDKSETLFATLRLMLQSGEGKIEPFAVGSRKGFKLKAGNGPSLPDRPGRSGPEYDTASYSVQMAWWVEGKHFVLYIGSQKPEAAVADVVANAAKGGVTAHPLLTRCSAKPAFTSVARGFADTGRVVSMAKSLLGPFVPGLKERLDDLGLGNLKAIVMNCGYDGKEFRAIWEIDLPGERKGFAKILKRDPIGLSDLPPLPADVSRFVAVRVDAGSFYDASLGLVEALSSFNQRDDDEDSRKNPAEKIRLHREELAKDFDKLLGMSVKDDLLPCLGDKVVVYQSPNEGLSIFGTVVCISLKDPAKAKALADRVNQGIETLISAPVKVRKKTLRGVEIRELYSRGFGIVVPTYAIVGDWLVISVNPQGVQGLVLRAKGDLPSWKPDAITAARIAKLPKDGCSLQYCDPTTTVKNLCCIGPQFFGAFGLRNSFRDNGDSDYDPLDIGLIPNGHELSKHLFPNLTVIRDDGKTVRIEANESLSVPLEVLGLEPVIFAGFLSFALGF